MKMTFVEWLKYLEKNNLEKDNGVYFYYNGLYTPIVA